MREKDAGVEAGAMEGMAWQQQSSGTPSSSLIRKELAVHHHPTFLAGSKVPA
jgi:hypothetical protein